MEVLSIRSRISRLYSAVPWVPGFFPAVLIALLIIPVPALGRGGDWSPVITDIVIEGIDGPERELLARELLSRQGEVFSEQKVEADRRHLNRLGLFRRVELQAVPVPEGISLRVMVLPRARYLPLISMGTSDENAFSMGGGVQSHDFMGSGLIASGSARTGGESRLKLDFENPWLRNLPLHYGFSLCAADRFNDLDRFEEDSIDGEIRLGTRLAENLRAGSLAGWFFLDSERPEITLGGGRTDYIPRLGFFIDYDNRDQAISARSGWNNEILLSRQGFWGIGRSDFWEAVIDLRRYQPLAGRHTLFLSSLSRIRTGTVGVEIPVHQDFHLGGTNTVRGWHRDSSRGKNEFIGTVEYRYRLVEPKRFLRERFGERVYMGVELALFGDAGRAWGKSLLPGGRGFLDGYGFGIRLLLPFVNTIRFDFAWGEPGEGMLHHFGVVPKVDQQRQRIR